jgi:pentatricopeptide repeat protein
VDEVSFNTLIKGCAQERMIGKAKQLFTQMLTRGMRPTYVTYNSIIDVFVRGNQMSEAWRFFD